MQIGDICKVIKNGHKKPQKGDLIMITRFVGSVYVEGTNLRTNTRHHYLKTELEVIHE
jgi:ribosomal protein L24